ncbi:hypothetical protein D9Q98_005489 [Chlorella vulgaris]|uniref:Uncharacterized protein n=1 Tax=Chlorella vulgaris TaxID=3077 RepID=A0A9D4TLX4_CHLVU|nr:hypothetical protein D9Q98_005489 [Chlorella vulgaris]
MNAALSTRSAFAGQQLQQQARHSAKHAKRMTCLAVKKLNSYDEGWNKGMGTIGIFFEDREKSSVNIFKQVQNKKLLSTVEKSGLLSTAEKAGLSLSKIESMGLLSTAENLGLLTAAENLLTTDPGKISSASLPFFVAAIAALVFFPQDNGLETFLAYTLALGAGGIGAGLFIGGFVVKGLQDE